MNDRIRVRLGKGNSAIYTGNVDLTKWSDEELARGQRRDKNGRFQGRPPQMIPMVVYKELARRQTEAVHKHLRDNVLEAAQVLTEMIRNPAVDDSAKVKAITMVFDRVLGKAPERVEVAMTDPIAEDLAAIVTYDDSEFIDVEAHEAENG